AGDPIRKPQIIPPAAIFFESVAHVHADDVNSPLVGIGRFQFENFILYGLGVPMQRLSTAGLKTSTWLFDAVCPFVLLVSLSYLPLRRRRPAAMAAEE